MPLISIIYSPFAYLQVDASVCTEMATMTDPDCMGPMDPGSSVTLEGIVWHETENGEFSQDLVHMHRVQRTGRSCTSERGVACDEAESVNCYRSTEFYGGERNVIFMDKMSY